MGDSRPRTCPNCGNQVPNPVACFCSQCGGELPRVDAPGLFRRAMRSFGRAFTGRTFSKSSLTGREPPIKYVWRSAHGVVRASRSDDERHYGQAHPEIFKVPGLSSSAKKVYYYLSRTADEDGYAFPFVRTIAARTKLSKTAVSQALNELEHAALLTRTHRFSKRGGSSNIYRVSPPQFGTRR